MNRVSRLPAEVLSVLERGDFDELVGTNEDGAMDAKSEPYWFTDSDKSKQDVVKHELAKDVSAFANSEGGLILIGFQTAKDPMAAGEFIECCRPFEPSLVNTEQYVKVLEDWIYPVIPGRDVKWYSSSQNAALVLSR